MDQTIAKKKCGNFLAGRLITRGGRISLDYESDLAALWRLGVRRRVLRAVCG